MVGLSHHRWLIQVQDNYIDFVQKYHTIHSSFRFSFPHSYWRRMSPVEQIAWLFWDDTFTFAERTIHGPGNIASELEDYVQRVRPYSETRLALGRWYRYLAYQGERVARRTRSLLGSR